MEIKELEQLQNNIKNRLFSIFGNTIEEFEEKSKESVFLGTIADFNIIKAMYNNSSTIHNESELKHLEKVLSSLSQKESKTNNKLDFSMKCVRQLVDFKNNQRFRGNELLQATYMTIFSRYNDNRDRTNNLFVTSELVDEVIREEHESEIGKIYITYERYQDFLYRYQNDNAETRRQKDYRHNKRFVLYVLKNIRNNMAHGDFCNIEKDGKQIVSLENDGGESIKAKFEFQCLNSICNELAQQMRGQKSDPLFEFKDELKNGTPDKMYYDNKDDEDKIISIIFPLYINSFIVYNFKKFKDLKMFIQKENGKRLEFVKQFYDRYNGESFLNKVVDYNENTVIDEFEAFIQIRNAVVHNKVSFQGGNILTEDGLKIPYEMFYDLLRNQELTLNYRNQDKEDTKEVK